MLDSLVLGIMILMMIGSVYIIYKTIRECYAMIDLEEDTDTIE